MLVQNESTKGAALLYSFHKVHKRPLTYLYTQLLGYSRRRLFSQRCVEDRFRFMIAGLLRRQTPDGRFAQRVAHKVLEPRFSSEGRQCALSAEQCGSSLSARW